MRKTILIAIAALGVGLIVTEQASAQWVRARVGAVMPYYSSGYYYPSYYSSGYYYPSYYSNGYYYPSYYSSGYYYPSSYYDSGYYNSGYYYPGNYWGNGYYYNGWYPGSMIIDTVTPRIGSGIRRVLR